SLATVASHARKWLRHLPNPPYTAAALVDSATEENLCHVFEEGKSWGWASMYLTSTPCADDTQDSVRQQQGQQHGGPLDESTGRRQAGPVLSHLPLQPPPGPQAANGRAVFRYQGGDLPVCCDGQTATQARFVSLVTKQCLDGLRLAGL